MVGARGKEVVQFPYFPAAAVASRGAHVQNLTDRLLGKFDGLCLWPTFSNSAHKRGYSTIYIVGTVLLDLPSSSEIGRRPIKKLDHYSYCPSPTPTTTTATPCRPGKGRQNDPQIPNHFPFFFKSQSVHQREGDDDLRNVS